MQISHLRISDVQAKNLLEFFVAGTTARVAAGLTGVNKNTATLFFTKMHKIIVYNIEKETSVFDGIIEVDESYFGGARKGKRGRGAAGKVPVFGLLKRKGKVYAQVVDNTKQTTLKHIITNKIVPDSVVCSDKYSSYNFLRASGFRHHRVNHSKEFVGKDKHHINGVENFWNQAKRHMRKFNSIKKENFNLFLQECVWRFNYPTSKQQLQTLKKWIKIYHKEQEKRTEKDKN